MILEAQRPDFFNTDSEFLRKAIGLIEENMADETFGVSELAEMIGMSRSNLLRKTQKLTGLSVSVFIRQVRLYNAQQLLADDTLNVSEVSYRVGFNSVSYFIKCYRELFGYPPGEESGTMSHQAEPAPMQETPSYSSNRLKKGRIASFVALLILVVLTAVFWPGSQKPEVALEKSIAVLPFQNDSADSSNVYIINGLMEAILNNLQKIEDLRVISRTSVEKYRNRTKNIAEISEELGVNYFIEGSGQKVGDQILLTIQLIEAPKDQHLWSEQYNRQVVDIFQLQAEVAKDIAQEIKVIITPEEERLITKPMTDNIEAYDLFLKGQEATNLGSFEGLEEAVGYYKEAIDKDPNFAVAYASVAICYYFLDVFRGERRYDEEMNTYADKALLLDAESGASLIAKGLYYRANNQYVQAVEYFEKVLEFNPNSGHAFNFLSDIYGNYLLDTEKYLEYALRGIKVNGIGADSITSSDSYLHLGNALIQNGFVDEAETSIKKSLAYNPDNVFSQYVHAFILMAKDRNLKRTEEMLLAVLAKDTTRIDVLQEVAKIYYAMEDYETAAVYYEKFLAIKEALNFQFFESEDVKIGFVFNQLGMTEKGTKYLDQFKVYAENDQSIYRGIMLAAYYSAIGEVDQAMVHFKEFSLQPRYQYWFVLLQEGDPIMDGLKSHPDYEVTAEKIKTNFWKEHRRMRAMLETAGLL